MIKISLSEKRLSSTTTILSLKNQWGTVWDFLRYISFYPWWMPSPFKNTFWSARLFELGPVGIRSRASCINHPMTSGWVQGSSGALVLKGTSDTYPKPCFARKPGTQPASLHLRCKPGSKPVYAFVNLNLHQVEPTQSVGKYKCPLHFYSAD